ncbi:MAG: bacterial Ig-like domain-containing protein, partial [Oscillospiraceae bacterium]|nr:bacterial Ig-like domain-containing protein [Oscillospiraceae bacterium]
MKLTNDISLASDWVPIGTVKNSSSVFIPTSARDVEKAEYGHGANIDPFMAILDGDGHTITVANNGYPLLGFVREATVKNLNIYGERINGSGLVLNSFVVYGIDGTYSTGVPDTITLDNVKLLSGSSTLRSGLIEGSGSGYNGITITNCIVETGVTVGYDASQSDIASFVGGMNGTIRNCLSYADVKGVNTVGGIIAKKMQSVGLCSVDNCVFLGTINASGHSVGGIVGAGYIAASAPNTPTVAVKNCYVAADIKGSAGVGGIIGNEGGVRGALNTSYVTDNFFYGTITSVDNAAADDYFLALANVKSSETFGAIFGFLRSVDVDRQYISNNYYHLIVATELDGIGKISDPTSFDESAACIQKTPDEFAVGTVLAQLNNSETSYKNWVQGELFPELDFAKAIITSLEISGNYKTQYYIGDVLDLSGIVITARWSDGKASEISLSDCNVSGYDSATRGIQSITLTYGAVNATLDVTVLKLPGGGSGASDLITVTLTIKGDTLHNSVEDGRVHGLKNGGLSDWVSKSFAVDLNATVADVIQRAITEAGISWSNPSGNYVESMTRNGVTIGEFTNGPHSGWMYTINGKLSDLGISEQFLESGDRIILFYSDDSTTEDGWEKISGTGDIPTGSGNSASDGDNNSSDADSETPLGSLGKASYDVVASETLDTPAITPDDNGTATVAIEAEKVTAAVDKAKKAVETAKADGKTNAVAEIVIPVKIDEANTGDAAIAVTTVEATLPAAAIKTIAEAKDVILTVESDISTVTLDTATIATIAANTQPNEAVTITATIIPIAVGGGVPDAPSDVLGVPPSVTANIPPAVRDIIDLGITVGNTAITNLGGTATISIPYTPTAEIATADYDLLTVYRISDNGSITEVHGASYDEGTMTFTTTQADKFFVSEW